MSDAPRRIGPTAETVPESAEQRARRIVRIQENSTPTVQYDLTAATKILDRARIDELCDESRTDDKERRFERRTVPERRREPAAPITPIDRRAYGPPPAAPPHPNTPAVIRTVPTGPAAPVARRDKVFANTVQRKFLLWDAIRRLMPWSRRK